MQSKSVVFSSGLVLAISGVIVFFVFSVMASDMTWEERFANPGEWVRFQTYSGLGFGLGGIGAFLLCVYYALYVRPEQKWGGD